ncbi:MAG: hypothetical protein ED557_06720 [Balneola sp.]|nr:MAG: hypothetical protein ED557_06720 [Balneola sp.]
MKASTLLLIICSFISTKSFSQDCNPANGKRSFDFIFDITRVDYQFSDSEYNTAAGVPNGLSIDTNCGKVFIFIPIEPIEISTGISLIGKGRIDTVFVAYFGGFSDKEGNYLNNFPYLDEEGTYGVRINGILQGESRFFRPHSIALIKNLRDELSLDISIPIDLSYLGFKPDEFEVQTLNEQFRVNISASQSLERNTN